MKRLLSLLVLAVLPSVSLAAQQAGGPLVSSRGMVASVRYPAAWTFVLTDVPGSFVFVASSAAMSQDDPFSIPDFEQMVQSRNPFVLAALVDQEHLGEVDWAQLQPFLDLMEGSASTQGEEVLTSEARLVCGLLGKLVVFNDEDTRLRGYLCVARSPDGQIAMFLAFCPIAEAEDYMGVFATMLTSFEPALPRSDFPGYVRAESGSLSIHKPEGWTAVHVESPLAEIAMLAKGKIDFLSFKEFDSELIRTIYPMAIIMRGPKDSLLGGDVRSAQGAIERLVSGLGSTDTILSRSPVYLSRVPGERVVALATLDTSSTRLKVWLFAVVSLSPDGEARVFLGFAPQDGFADSQREFEEMSASLLFQPSRR